MKRESGFTLIELLVVVMIIGILAAIGVATLTRSRASANEASAIGSIRAIGSGNLAYASSCGMGFFATALPTLAVPPPGSTNPFVSPDLTSAAVVRKSGYDITMAPGAGSTPGINDCNGTNTATSFYLRAEPVTFGISGNRAFATTAAVNNTIWVSNAAAAPAEPFGAPALPLQ